MQEKKIIIVAPLNWGLGHAARCIPIIKALLDKNYEVIIASDGGALELLQKEFPELESFELPAYNIHYAEKFFTLNLFLQSFKIFFAVVRENIFLKKFLIKKFEKKNSEKFFQKKILKNIFEKKISEKKMTNSGIYAGDEKSPSSIVHRPSSKIYAIISDNRLGFFNRAAEKNIFITHQYNIKTPYRLLDFFINIINHFFINRYDECWIPDIEGTPNLSGELSHNNSVNKNKTRFIGALTGKKHFDAPKIYDIIAVLSGPEPERTHLEKIIISEFEKYIKNHPEKKLCLVRGVISYQLSAISYQQPVENKSEAIQNTRDNINPTFKNKLEAIKQARSVSSPTSSKNKSEAIQNMRSSPNPITNHQSPITNHQYPFDIFDFLINDALNEKLMQSDILIARSGYSTIMDLAALKMPAILIPTPGQTEQEYLAQKLTQENIFAGTTQNSFDLEKALAAAKNFTGFKKNNFIYDSLIEVIGL